MANLKIKIDAREIRKTRAELTRAKQKIDQPKGLHNTMRLYQRTRWRTNLYTEGMIYGPWQGLKGSTLQIRNRRGFASGPILYEAGAGRVRNSSYGNHGYLSKRGTKRPKPSRMGHQGGLLHIWVKENIMKDRFVHSGGMASTIWEFRARGKASTGAYAVFHDQGYTTSGMIKGKRVPARRIFDMNEADEQQHLTNTAIYVHKVLASIFTGM